MRYWDFVITFPRAFFEMHVFRRIGVGGSRTFGPQHSWRDGQSRAEMQLRVLCGTAVLRQVDLLTWVTPMAVSTHLSPGRVGHLAGGCVFHDALL